MTTTEQRQSYGCGFELPIQDVHPWAPPDGNLGFRHEQLPICPGYLVRLPEVQFVARAHKHWEKSQLAMFCGEQPSEGVMACIEIYDHESAVAAHWARMPADKGGGAK